MFEQKNYAAEGVLSQDMMALQKAVAQEDASRKARYDYWKSMSLNDKLSEDQQKIANSVAGGSMEVGRDMQGNPITSHSVANGATYDPTWARAKSLDDALELQKKGYYLPSLSTMNPNAANAMNQYNLLSRQNQTVGVLTPQQIQSNEHQLRTLKELLLQPDNVRDVIGGLQGNNPILNAGR